MWIVNCRRGAVTVFLTIVFTALLLLAGAIIDAARIMLAEKRVQGALDSAVRSTLAGYHANLVGEFGLYGVYAQPEVTNSYFLANMREHNNGLNLIRYNIRQDVAVEYNAGLLNHEHFKDQILQYMKYRAPLAVTENLLARLVDSGLGEKTAVMTLGQKAADTRELLKDELAGLNRSIAGVQSFFPLKGVEISTPAIRGAIGEMESIINMLDTVLEPRLNEYENAVGELNSSMSERIDQDQKPLPEAVVLRSKINGLRRKVQDSINVLKRLEELSAKAEKTENENSSSGPSDNNSSNCLQSQISSLQVLLEGVEKISFPTQDRGVISKKVVDEPGRIKEYLRQKLKLEKINPDDLIPGHVFTAETDAGKGGLGAEMPDPGADGIYRMNEKFAITEGKKVISFLSSLSRKVENLAGGARNSLYLAAYVLDKFTYLTSSTARDHYFKKGEAEYILCGDNSEIRNVISVCGQIWFMRFALNTLYSFFESPVPHPLARLAYSVMEGLFKASADMRDLYEGKRVSLFPGKIVSAGGTISDNPSEKFGLGYSDHLLILLLMQDEETQLNRMRNLIQVNLRKMKGEPGFILENCRTICHAKAEVEINLWFAPVLHLDKFGLDRFKDGKYLIVCESTVGF